METTMKILSALGSSALFTTLLLCACGSENSQGVATPPPVDANTAITLDRSACFGNCPSYTLSIGGDGTVAYVGRQYVNVAGTASSQIPVSSVQELADEMYRANYFGLTVPETCPQGIASDFPTVVTSLTIEGNTHMVVHDHGNQCAPAALTTLEDRIDAVAGSAQWVACNSQGGSCPL
jgi:hypothetical protein